MAMVTQIALQAPCQTDVKGCQMPAKPAPPLMARLALPRQCSRMLGRLLALPLYESLPAATRAYHAATTEAERHLAMRLRLRLLAEGHAKLQQAEPVSEEIIMPEPPEAEPEPEIVPEIAEDITPPPPKPKVKMMQMDLNSDLLSQMMAGLEDEEES
jgi:hypothetical protein